MHIIMDFILGFVVVNLLLLVPAAMVATMLQLMGIGVTVDLAILTTLVWLPGFLVISITLLIERSKKL